MKEVLARWNRKPRAEAAKEILPCCGSTAWANQVAARRPIHNEAALLAACDEVWRNLPEPDWVEAFESHPRNERRLQNDHRTELLEAAEAQRHIAHIRLKKWLDS